MPTRMKTEGTRRAQELHARFFRGAAALSVIAMMAAGYQVFPRRLTGAGSGNDVVQRHLS